jgi:hypothetical protein
MKTGGGEAKTMLVVKLNNLKARQLEETLHAAGFTAQEVLVSWSESGSKSEVSFKAESSSDLLCYLKIQTQTTTDEDVAKAVLHDCGIEIIETKPRLGALVPLRKALGDNAQPK